MITWYRLLLRFYPASFRAEYGADMEAVFAAKLGAAVGLGSYLALWVEAVADVARHAVPLHAELLLQDIRQSLRTMARAPGFALTVVVLAGLGIGANTAVFSVADRVLIRALPFPEADRLVRLWESPPGYSRMEVSPPNYRDWRAIATSFESMASYEVRSANLVGAGEPVRVPGAAIAAEVFALLGRQALLGRAFTEDDGAPDAPASVVLSHDLWQREFGADASVLGRTLMLDDEPHTVIGVMPPDFSFPDRNAELWMIQRLAPSDFEDRNNNYLHVVARLHAGVRLEDARAEMRSVMQRLEAEYPVENEGKSATVNRLADEIPAQSRLLLLALMGASLCVLLITCSNLANLLLARARGRRRELAVRNALGAGPERLTRQLLTESIVLALPGGLLGVGLAYVSVPLLDRLAPEALPLAGTSSLDGRVLVFALGITLLTAIGFGALPALRAGRHASGSDLRGDGRAGGGRSGNTRGVLVAAEVTATVALLVVSGLLLRALGRVQTIDPGFQADGVITMRTWLPWPRYASVAARAAFYDRVLSETRALPGVSDAAYTSFLPIVLGGGIWPVEVGGVAPIRSATESASLRFVTEGYFATLGIPILRGRGVLESDTQDTQPVAVVSESFAERYWPGRDPIGRTFTFAFFERTVVGTAGDVRVRGLERESEPQVYLPHQQVPDGGLIFYAPKDLAVHSAGDPMQLVPAIREIVRRADPTQPINAVQRLEDVIAQHTAPRRTQLRVISAFAALAMLLAVVGIHGLLAFNANQRAREIGVRIALGARRTGILAMVLREGLVLGLVGVTCGGLLGYFAARALQALLAGVPPADVATFGAAAGLALVTTVAGSLHPAVRAARVDANALLRGE